MSVCDGLFVELKRLTRNAFIALISKRDVADEVKCGGFFGGRHETEADPSF